MLTKFSNLIKETTFLAGSDTLEKNAAVYSAWKEAMASQEDLRINVKIKMLKGTTLHLTASNGIWAQEIQLRSYQIMKKINNILKNNTTFRIKEIVVFVSSR